jgi:hypothetical protein
MRSLAFGKERSKKKLQTQFVTNNMEEACKFFFFFFTNYLFKNN